MKKAKKLLAILPLLFMMAGCGEKSSSSDPTTTDNTVITTNNQDDKTDVRYQIYLSAVSAGYNGNYEEWLESIKGDSIQLKVENNYVMFKYSQATEWVNLISLDALKGDAGATGKNSKLQVADGFIQWQNEGDTTWNNLIALDDLKGVDGNSRKTDMRVNNDYIQWKYEGDTTWNDLLDLSTLKGADGKNATMQVSGGYIQWKVDGEDEWTNLIEVASLKGDTGANGKKVSLTVADNFIKWQYEGDTSWNELISIDDLKGDTGSVGKKSLMRNNGTYIQWQNDGDGENWNNLIALSDLAGAAGDAVELREENGIIQWKYESETDWTNLYDFNQNTQTFEVYFDYDGGDGVIPFIDLEYFDLIGFRGDKVEFGHKVRKPNDPYKDGYEFDGWYYDDEKWLFNVYVVTEDILLKAKFTEIEVKEQTFNDIDIFNYNYDDESDTFSIKGIEKIYENVKFKNVFLPNNISEMKANAFDKLGEIENIYYNGTIEDWCGITTTSNIMQYCNHFYYLDENGEVTVNGIRYSSLDILEIPETVTMIGKAQFACRDVANGINRLILPNTLEIIDEAAFYNNEAIEAVYYKGTLAEWCNIEMSGENGTNPLGAGIRSKINTRLFVLNDSGDFYEVYGDLFIPETVTKIGDYQFQGLNRINTVYISKNVTSIGINPFAYCSSITEILVDDENTKYTSKCGTKECNAIIDTDADEYHNVSVITGCKNTDFANLDVDIIEKYAFANVIFEEVVISEGITEIRKGAFTGSTLTKVTLPESLYSIGEFAFVACENLNTIVDNTVTLFAIGMYAFAYCYELTYFETHTILDYLGEAVFMGDTKLETVKLLGSSNFSTIEFGTFEFCTGIKTLIIGKNIKTIEDQAFVSSLSYDTKIFFEGTQAEWEAITVSYYDNPGLQDATVYYYSAGNPGAGNYWYYDNVTGEPTLWNN